MHLQLVVALLAPAACAAARANLCFTAHEKTALYCREKPTVGPLEVYEDGESSQRARTMYWGKGGRLCPAKGKCWRAPRPPVHILAANSDLPRPGALALSALCLGVPALLFLAAGRSGRGDAASKPAAVPKAGFGARVAQGLLRFASQPWFPAIAAAGTAINLFTIVFTAATVVLFLGAILGQPKRWRSTAIANALGATAGSAVLLMLVRVQGDGLLEQQFPTVLASPAWAKTTALMQSYGLGGMVLVASLPLILHPVIAFGVLSGASDATILGIILGGRTLKYLVMGYVTVSAPAALRFFGINASLVDMATKATRAEGETGRA